MKYRAARRLLENMVPILLSILPAWGCGPRAEPWSLRTREQNRTFSPPGHPRWTLVYRDSRPPAAVARDGPAEIRSLTDDQPALVFIHGLGGSKAVWRPVAGEFTASHRIITLDLLGHGQSAAPEDFDYRMSSQADVVCNLLADLKLQRFVLVGASYGGGVAMEAAQRLIERKCDALAGLVLVDGAVTLFPPPASVKYARSRVLKWFAVNVLSSDALIEILLRNAFHNFDLVSEEMKSEYRLTFSDRGRRRAIASAGKVMFEELKERADRDVEYRQVTCPTQLIWGRLDRTVPLEVMQRLASLLPVVRTAIVEDCVHTPAEEKPAETAAILRDFLDWIGRAE